MRKSSLHGCSISEQANHFGALKCQLCLKIDIHYHTSRFRPSLYRIFIVLINTIFFCALSVSDCDPFVLRLGLNSYESSFVISVSTNGAV